METGSILVVSPKESDHAFIRGLFQSPEWQVYTVNSWRRAFDQLSRAPAGVVLCEKDLPDGAWEEVLAGIKAMRNAPVLIVTAEQVDDKLWAKVLNLGGYDVLMKPFDRNEVSRVIHLAWLNWTHTRAGSLRAAASA